MQRLEVLESAVEGPETLRRLFVPAVLVSSVAVVLLVFWLFPSVFPWIAVAALIVLAGVGGYLVGTRHYRHQLLRLRTGILDAQEGILKPVDPAPKGDRFVDALYRDYNETVTVLGRMFKLVEECQNRMVNERNRMNVIVQAMPAAVLGVDDNLCINIANRHAEELFAPHIGPLVGDGLFNLLHFEEEDRNKIRDAFLYKQCIRNRIVNLQLSGEDTWLSINLSFITEREGDMTAIITLLDVTDYKHLQETVYNREKLVAMGQLAAGVAHELNTPLGTISGRAQLLSESAGDMPVVRDTAQVIADEARRCTGIIRNLLNYTRRDRCHDGSCDLNNLVDEIIETFMSCRLKSSPIIVECDLAEGLPMTRVDCGELDIVITNILLNAIQALEDVEDAKIVVRSYAAGDSMLDLVIEDNGPGVVPKDRSRIFEPFFTTKDVGEGSGLGLSISYALLEKRGGTIIYDGGYADGARFKLKLPAFKASN